MSGVPIDHKTAILTRKHLHGKSEKINSNSSLFLFIDLYSRVGDSLIELINLFSSGQFEEMKEQLTLDEFNKIATQLYVSKKDMYTKTYTTFEQYRSVLLHTLEGLQQGVYQYCKLEETNTKLEACEEKARILDDMELLKEYIEEKQREMVVFPSVVQSTRVRAKIKEPYNTYIQVYGWPENGIFEPDRIAMIIQELGLEE